MCKQCEKDAVLEMLTESLRPVIIRNPMALSGDALADALGDDSKAPEITEGD